MCKVWAISSSRHLFKYTRKKYNPLKIKRGQISVISEISLILSKTTSAFPLISPQIY